MFERFWGNAGVAEALEQMTAQDRLAQTLLFAGPEGVGKATLARRLGARLLGYPERIERDDLSLSDNLEIVASRERWPAEKRNEDPLLFATHPDFVTFAPDGPLRQISIQQTRLLKERSQFLPSRGKRRIFLIDHVDRANDQAANSLLKTLEEPPEPEAMRAFARERGLDQPERRVRLAAGSPGLAISLDLELYDKRRAAMLALLKTAAGTAPFSAWLPVSEALGRAKSEKLELYLKLLYELLRDLLILREGSGEIRNEDIRRELEALAVTVEFRWISKAVALVDEIVDLVRRNIQKTIALDSLIANLRAA